MQNSKSFKISDMAFIAMFAAVMAVCSWICIPGPVPFTLQTFAVFLAVGVLGGKNGSLAVLIYLLLGIIGIPVFAGFNSGIGYIMGSTGGYIAGFLLSALVMWAIESLFGKKNFVFIFSMLAGLIVCYAFGTAWFMYVYAESHGAIGLWSTLLMCVVPYIIPDIIKIAIAFLMREKFSKILKINR